jgi:hypothetical protein
VIIEDSGNKKMHNLLIHKYSNYHLILNEENIGLVESIDKAYSSISEPFIFHTEDDFEFYKSGFIEKSLEILETEENIMQVYIRPASESDNPMEPQIYNIGESSYRLFGNTPEGFWHGYCLQCGLRKMSAYDKIKPFTQWSDKKDALSLRECKIGQAYYDLGYRVAVLPESYARHTGKDRSTCGNYNI